MGHLQSSIVWVYSGQMFQPGPCYLGGRRLGLIQSALHLQLDQVGTCGCRLINAALGAKLGKRCRFQSQLNFNVSKLVFNSSVKPEYILLITRKVTVNLRSPDLV
jgi:hypothetical protein